jgi:signal transduction histidine kinase
VGLFASGCRKEKKGNGRIGECAYRSGCPFPGTAEAGTEDLPKLGFRQRIWYNGSAGISVLRADPASTQFSRRDDCMKAPFSHDPFYYAITNALFETYESIYDIDLQSGAYRRYYESEAYSELELKSSGEDFFTALPEHVARTIYPEDQEYVLKMLRPDVLIPALEKTRYYSFVYRLLVEGQPVYHKIRAVLEQIDGKKHILMGVHNVDETIRQEQTHRNELASMYQKEKNHMEAILASASGYLEVNLTQDTVLEKSNNLLPDKAEIAMQFPDGEPYSGYSRLWILEHYITKNKNKYAQISDREYLLACFLRGEKRASVSFSLRKKTGDEQPCKEVFYLYRDHASGDVMAFCVVYDLTEQQRQEKEIQELERALQMSRIRNFTSQMQPHFLYNALGSIQEIVLEDPQYASDLIGDFTTHLRSCIRAMANDRPLPFSQELDNIRAYVNIEQMRFGKKLQVIYEIGPEAFEILPLSVQPLVENAIRHGIYGRGVRGGTVAIRSGQTDRDWVVEVEDNGVGFDVDAYFRQMEDGEKDSTGLKNIIFRLEKVMHGRVEISSTVDVGTKVTVRIPKENSI